MGTSEDMADQINLAESVKVALLYYFIPPGRGNVVFLLMGHELSTNVQFLPFLQGQFDQPCLQVLTELNLT